MNDKIYIAAIQENNHLALRKMYQHFLPQILSLVQQNSGNLEDAQDVLQDGLMIVFEKIKQPNFQLTSSFGTFLYSICRFVWLRKLKKKHRKDVTIEDQEGLIDDADVEQQLQEEEKWRLFKQHLGQLGAECQKVLKLFFTKKKMAEIAQEMEYTKEFAKTKKYLCQKKLIQSIQKDRIYKELL